jgi:hypothetical protein
MIAVFVTFDSDAPTKSESADEKFAEIIELVDNA